jgi:hypothetical protein
MEARVLPRIIETLDFLAPFFIFYPFVGA